MFGWWARTYPAAVQFTRAVLLTVALRMKIFISYRHSESIAAEANLIRDRLGQQFGAGSAFLDTSTLVAGEVFPAALEGSLRACKMVMVLIDPHWLASVARLHNPGDWVRRELEIALRRRADDGIRVIPLLVQGASMPDPATLPPTLAGLADLQAITLRGSTLDDDLTAMMQRLTGWTPEHFMQWLRARRQAAMAVAAGVLVLLCASVVALFDALTVDTRLEAMTLAWAELVDPPRPDKRLLTVAIDRRTEQVLSKPFDRSWRAEHARVIRALAEGGAAAVVFDIHLEGASPHDQALIEAAEAARARGTRVVFGLPKAGAVSVLPTPAIEFGLLCIGTELEWARLAAFALRRPAQQLAANHWQQPANPSAPLEPPATAAGTTARWEYQAALGLRAVVPQAAIHELDFEHRQVRGLQQDGASPLRLPFTRGDTVASEQACDALQLGDQVAQRLVRFTSLQELRDPTRRLRYEALCCAPGGAAAVAGATAVADKARYHGKIVLIGTELHARELRSVLRGLHSESRWGYEIHADLINNVLAGADLRPADKLAQFLMMLAMGALGLTVRFWRRLWTPWRGRSLLVLVPLIYLVFSIALCAVGQWLLNIAYHLGAYFFAYWVSGLLLRHRGLDIERHA